ncbi:hypothetical protein KSP40_PGU012840 [Platanthera guangdongensis]|uniref:Uncharacterized protein n=1 Tax=Platanthera guangdongensis TaxID=2320717 RepID=A0ABR2LF09_9ASPA
MQVLNIRELGALVAKVSCSSLLQRDADEAGRSNSLLSSNICEQLRLSPPLCYSVPPLVVFADGNARLVCRTESSYMMTFDIVVNTALVDAMKILDVAAMNSPK